MNRKYIKPVACFLVICFLNQIIFPISAFALTGGPSQPEVQSFEPVSTTQMVDLFSGDFNYNIPLMEIDGYPINIAYHSGVTMDQEASWVGLGWNLNPGVINRNMRGLPDDFKGDVIKKTTILKADQTVGIDLGASFELFGFTRKPKGENKSRPDSLLTLNLGLNFGINYNNYKGVGYEFGFTPSLLSSGKFKSCYSLGMSSSSSGSTDLTPTYGFNFLSDSKTKNDNGIDGKIGLSINTKQGLKALTIQGKLPQSMRGRSTTYSFASQSYVPTIQHSMSNISVGFGFKTGPKFTGTFPNSHITGYYASQGLGNGGKRETERGGFGALFLQDAKWNDGALMDFNREKDGSFSSKSPILAIPQLTYDLYSYSGQGIGGMFRTFRSDMPTLQDPEIVSSSLPSGNISMDLGFGNLVKLGASVSYNYNQSSSGAWVDNEINSNVLRKIGFDLVGSEVKNKPLFEPTYFKSVGELTSTSTDFLPYEDLVSPLKLNLSNPLSSTKIVRNNLPMFVGGNIVSLQAASSTRRLSRDKRNTFIGKLTNAESKFCFDESIHSYPLVEEGYGDGFVPEIIPRQNSTVRQPHHTSEISVTKADGSKYVYGIAAYNNEQNEFSFTNSKNLDDGSEPAKYCELGTVSYDSGDNFETDERNYGGIDRYFDKTKLPAYAHSYLLTSILSNDYIDVDLNGASPNDLGSYTKINYSRVNSNYKWRVPYNENTANFDEGLKSEKYDNKANFIFGKKEIWHVQSIEGKNHIALFYISHRQDGLGVTDVHGGKDSDQKSFRLDSIKLFSFTDLIHPIKSVYFEYDYSLCPNVDNNSGATIDGNEAKGKLTLKKIYFTHGNSFKGKYNSYIFDYNYGDNNAYNPDYHLKAYDRWGYYKPAAENVTADNSLGPCDVSNTLLSTEFPYVIQNKELEDVYSSAWHLTGITLPSGGHINIEYESDDYAFVQDRNAMQMYRLYGFSSSYSGDIGKFLYSDEDEENNYAYMFFKIDPSITTADEFKRLVRNNLNDNNLYYNVLIDLNDEGTYEYIKGYAETEDFGIRDHSGNHLGWVKLVEPNIRGKLSHKCNPISLESWQFTRMYLPHLINPGANMIKSNTDIGGSFLELGKTIIGFIPGVKELIQGIYPKLREKHFAREVILEKSWVRLNNLTGYKLGGGNRVKRISMSDKWNNLEGSSNSRTEEFGQEFDYTINETIGIFAGKTISSGVASYEPLTGGDENPFRQAIPFKVKNRWTPDDKYYSEEPLGESFFPSASVGYSRVTVRNIGNVSEGNLARNGTGKVVNEFFTSRDFPTIIKNSGTDIVEKDPGVILKLLKVLNESSLTMTQSFLVELNDMHGKPKAVWNYSQQMIESLKTEDAYSGVKYEYFQEVGVDGRTRLKNSVDVIYPNNTVGTGTLGVDAEAFADSRQFKTKSFSGGIDLNLDVFFAGVAPVSIISGYPQISFDRSEFSSGVAMKVVHRTGILKAVTAFEEGASLRTENTHFDSETGEVLVTKTQNEFKDYIYNSSYPAHWTYDNMGAKYKNEGAVFQLVYSSATENSFKVKVGGTEYSPSVYLAIGDRLRIDTGTTCIYEKGVWVHKTDNGNWRLIDENGINISLSNSPASPYYAKVIESGFKNMQSTPITQITSLVNPVSGSSFENSDSILNASVNEFDSKWTMADCYTNFDKVDECLNGEAVELLNYFIKSGIINKEYCDTATNNQGELINFDTSYGGLTTFRNSKLKKAMEKCTSPSNLYKIKRFGKMDPFPTMNRYLFGFEIEPISNCTTGCIKTDVIMQIHVTTRNALSGSDISKYPVRYETDENTSFHSIGDFLHSPDSYNSETGICTRNGNYIFFTTKAPNDDTVFANSRAYVYVTSLKRETNICDGKPNAIVKVNPYLKGIRNNWKPKKSWVYNDVRRNQTTTNIRRDGTFSSFNNFWELNEGKLTKSTSLANWVYTKEVIKYGPGGQEIESKNSLNIYSSTLLQHNNTLPKAVANNAKYNQIYAQSFEMELGNNNTYPYSIGCPTDHEMYKINNTFIDTLNYHTGRSSYKITNNTRITNSYAFRGDKTYSTGTSEYTTDTGDYNGIFLPDSGKYILSAWVKVGSDPLNKNYSGSGVLVTTSPDIPINDSTVQTQNHKFFVTPSGPIIEGWQRIQGEFTLASNMKTISIRLIPATGITTYFDDLRIHPYNALMKSYVYDPRTIKLMSELDENNYATFYEYDQSGENLVRVKKETERGIFTIKEFRKSIIKRQP